MGILTIVYYKTSSLKYVRKLMCEKGHCCVFLQKLFMKSRENGFLTWVHPNNSQYTCFSTDARTLHSRGIKIEFLDLWPICFVTFECVFFTSKFKSWYFPMEMKTIKKFNKIQSTNECFQILYFRLQQLVSIDGCNRLDVLKWICYFACISKQFLMILRRV